MTRPLISLVMIVKNEASNIRATLESAKPFVDRWTILDTGSTDGTRELVRDVMGANEFFDGGTPPGTLYHGAFVDYATTRNEALGLDTGHRGNVGDTCVRCLQTIVEGAWKCENDAVFTLMLSGDETLHGGAELRAFLEAHRDAPEGAYCVTMESGSRTWPYTRVLRTDAGWRYQGEIHERPVGPAGEVFAETIPGVRVVHAASDPERKWKRLREYDLPRLTKKVEDTSIPLDERAHAMFFLAETHAVLAGACNPEEHGGPWLTHQYQAMSLYFRYAQLAEQSDRPAYDLDKALYAYFLYYHLAENVGIYTSAELVERLTALVEAAPKMPEARYLLAQHAAIVDARKGVFLALEAAKVAKEAKADTGRTFQVTDTRLEWLSLRLAAACALELKNVDQAKQLAKRALEAGAPREAFKGLFE